MQSFVYNTAEVSLLDRMGAQLSTQDKDNLNRFPSHRRPSKPNRALCAIAETNEEHLR